MKKIICLTLMALALLFTGCATDELYAKGKEDYIVGREIVKVIPKDQETDYTLGLVDAVATSYDSLRELFRASLDDEEKKPDANSSQITSILSE